MTAKPKTPRKPIGPAMRESKLMAAYLTECREARTTASGNVSLGRLPGFPAYTGDPDVVEKAIGAIEEKARAARQPVAELRLRQRVLDLRGALAALRSRNEASTARDWFIENGLRWAAEQHPPIRYGALREMGVPAKDLKEAGFHAAS